MAGIDWTYVQAASDDILADGFAALRARPVVKAADVHEEGPCAYLLSLNGEPRYAGEGQNGAQRLKQQFREATSTFYKTYAKRTAAGKRAPIGAFDVQAMPALLGRKELEEFGIVHLTDRLNKFQLDKREPREAAEDTGLWDIVQAQREPLLAQGEAAALAAIPKPWFDCQPAATPGLYLVLRKDRLIYIGESSDLAARHETHSEDTYFSALRRHIGTEILGFELQEVGGRKRYFSDDEDWKITRTLQDCMAVFLTVQLGRYELEDRLIKAHLPELNRKGAVAPMQAA